MENAQALSAGPNAVTEATASDECIAQAQRLPPPLQSELLVAASEPAENSENEGALRSVRSPSPSAFKSKPNMRAVRQTAIGSYLKTTKSGNKKSTQAGIVDSDGTTTVHGIVHGIRHRRRALVIRDPTAPVMIHNPTPPSPISPTNRSQPVTSHDIPSNPHSSLFPPDSPIEPSNRAPDTASRPLSPAHRFAPLSPTANVDEEHSRSRLNTNLFLIQGSSFQDPLDQIILEEGQSCAKAQETKRIEIEGPEKWGAHILADSLSLTSLQKDWRSVQSMLPEAWKWDLEYRTVRTAVHRHWAAMYGSWTCTPLEPGEPMMYPLTIAKAPLVLPVEYRWPPANGLTPPPDPHPAFPLNCRAGLSIEVVRDIFLTFQGSIGFYLLINGFLQIIVPGDFDTSWASSHLPHKYGGLKVCYIEGTLEPSMLTSTTETSDTGASSNLLGTPSRKPAPSPLAHAPAQSSAKKTSLKLNDFKEARPLSAHRREKYTGRVGLKVAREGSPFVVMSTHIITEAILAKSSWEAVRSLWSDTQLTRLDHDWNDYIEIWASDQKVSEYLID